SFFSLRFGLSIIFCCCYASALPRCRSKCGGIPIDYPFGLDDGCGSPLFRRVLSCSAAGELLLRTPSSNYPVVNITYSARSHILISDPYAWPCRGGAAGGGVPFSLDSGVPLRLSPVNDFLFFNCSGEDVVMEPKPLFCRRFPERCDFACDTASYLCRRLPECGGGGGGGGASCCAYFPRGSESLRMMRRRCAGYAGVYWRNSGEEFQTPAYGLRVDFDFPVSGRCRRCQDSGGSCGFDVADARRFLCLCGGGDSSPAYCTGAVAGVSVAGVFAGAGIWYLQKRLRAKPSVNHGVQTNENRLF
ncbi:hypothetical protein M569_10129, partial [Genlisea aurea]